MAYFVLMCYGHSILPPSLTLHTNTILPLTPLWELTSLPTPPAGREWIAAPPQNPTPALGLLSFGIALPNEKSCARPCPCRNNLINVVTTLDTVNQLCNLLFSQKAITKTKQILLCCCVPLLTLQDNTVMSSVVNLLNLLATVRCQREGTYQ